MTVTITTNIYSGILENAVLLTTWVQNDTWHVNIAKNIIFQAVIHNTACTHESPALYQGRLHKGDKEKAKIENVFHLNSHGCQ